MEHTEPMARARAHLGEVVDRARHAGRPTVLTDHRKPVAAVISFQQYEEYLRLRDAADRAQVEKAIADMDSGNARVSFTNVDDMMREAGLAS
jgi:prevent-host-death family protein